MWLAVGFFVLAGIWLGALVYMFFNGGLNTKHGFVGFAKKPQEMDAMIARVQERQARYDRWRKSLNR
jgi:hypothetical protein